MDAGQHHPPGHEELDQQFGLPPQIAEVVDQAITTSARPPTGPPPVAARGTPLLARRRPCLRRTPRRHRSHVGHRERDDQPRRQRQRDPRIHGQTAPRGVGTTCTFRAFGLSSRPHRGASRRITAVSVTEMTNPTPHARGISRLQRGPVIPGRFRGYRELGHRSGSTRWTGTSVI